MESLANALSGMMTFSLMTFILAERPESQTWRAIRVHAWIRARALARRCARRRSIQHGVALSQPPCQASCQICLA